MDFDHSGKVKDLISRLNRFMAEEIYPQEDEVEHWLLDPETQWSLPPCFAHLKERAKAEGLWNLFSPARIWRMEPRAHES